MSRYIFKVYRDSKREWRWSLITRRNKKIVADSAEGYKRRGQINRQIGKLQREIGNAELVEFVL